MKLEKIVLLLLCSIFLLSLLFLAEAHEGESHDLSQEERESREQIDFEEFRMNIADRGYTLDDSELLDEFRILESLAKATSSDYHVLFDKYYSLRIPFLEEYSEAHKEHRKKFF